MIHVLVVPSMKQRQLLRAVRWIIRAVEIEYEVGRGLVGGVGVRTKPVDADTGQAVHLGPRDRVLQPRQRGLRAQRRAAVARHGLERGILPEAGRVVDVFVARRNVAEALAQQRRDLVGDIPPVSRLGDAATDVGGEAEVRIEFPDQQQARVRGERAAGEIDDRCGLESKAKLAITLCSHRTFSVGIPSRPESPRPYHDFRVRDGVCMYSFVNYPGSGSDPVRQAPSCGGGSM